MAREFGSPPVIARVPATPEHVRALVLRHDDACEVAACGVTKEAAIAQSMARSLWSEAYLVGGEVAAIMGLGVTAMVGGHGVPWLLTGPACERHKRRFMIESKHQIERMRAQLLPLINYVHADYRRAVRWLGWLGFTIEPLVLLNGAPFHRVILEN